MVLHCKLVESNIAESAGLMLLLLLLLLQWLLAAISLSAGVQRTEATTAALAGGADD
jgi:hypothetical protein